jgi:small-conductance mechanosensitive channel
MSSLERHLIGAWLLAMLLATAVALLAVWPQATDSQAPNYHAPYLPVLHLRMTSDVSLLLIAWLAGILGGLIHATSTLAARAGYRHLAAAWTLWYLTHPFLGGTLAVFTIFVARGGLLTANPGPAQAVNLYGIAAIAGVAGLFTRKIMTMLENVVDGISHIVPTTARDLHAAAGAAAIAAADAATKAATTPPQR